MNGERKYKIGIDMRMAGEGFGIGRYVTELALSLIKRNAFDYYFFFDKTFSSKSFDKIKTAHPKCFLTDARYYSADEQIKFPFFLKKFKLDLIHFPNFNVPIFSPTPFVVTIHDLIHHRFPGRKKRNFVHRLAYKKIIGRAINASEKIIAVSQFTKNDIIKLFSVDPGKISVVYEGVSEACQQFSGVDTDLKILKSLGVKSPYFLAVGVWRKYKNFGLLADAFEKFAAREKSPCTLVIAGEEDKNYPEIKQTVISQHAGDYLKILGKVDESQLYALYRNALCLVNPSLSEGFGLTTIEAQACGTPVLASWIPVSKEILGDSAEYFDPYDRDSLAGALSNVSKDSGLRKKLSERGLKNSKKLTWVEAAIQTEKIYSESIKNK